MKLDRVKFKVKSTKAFRDSVKESEAEGRLGQEFRLDGSCGIGKLMPLYSSKKAYEADIAALFGGSGEILSEDRGWFNLNREARAAKVTIGYGLVDTQEFEDCRLDCIQILVQKGKVAEIKARLRVYPNAKQLGKVNALLKNEITVSMNGEGFAAQPGDDPSQPELPMGARDQDEDEGDGSEDPPAAGPDEALPGVPKSEGPAPDSPEAHRQTTQDLRDAGILAQPVGRTKQPPSTAHGEVLVDGQKPPQRPARKRPGATTH